MKYEELPFDSAHFGYRIARLTSPPSELEEAPIDCFYVHCDPADCAALQALARPGALLADVRLTLMGVSSAGAVLEEARPEDRTELEAVAGGAHRDSRFYFDPHFADSACDALYRLWITKSCTGWADQVLVTRDTQGPTGYVTCHIDSPAMGRIGLIAVAERARRGGLGGQLVDGARHWFFTQGVGEVSVVTQGRNIGALRLYEKHGFRMARLELIYHYWPDSTKQCL